MSVKKRFMEHLKQKGAIPKNYDCGGMAMGGVVRHEESEWDNDDEEYNNHTDTSGEPMTYGENYMRGYAFGGEIRAERHSTPEPSLRGRQYGKPNYPGPAEHEQPDQMMSEQEIRHHMVKAINARKRAKGY